LDYPQVADDPQTWFTGLAVVNPNPDPVRVTVEVFDSFGARVGISQGLDPIPAGGRISRLLSQMVPSLPAMGSGYFKVHAEQAVYSFAVFGPRSLSSLAAIPPTASR
jgi:hypothetical protein